MVINKDFVLRKVGSQYVAAAVGESAKSFNGMIKLNDTAAFIWSCLENGTEKDMIIKLLCRKYAVDYETAQNDTENILDILLENGILANE